MTRWDFVKILKDNPIKVNKSELLKSTNKSYQHLKAIHIDKENKNHQPFTINSIKTEAFKHKTKTLDKIPFSRVVAVQSKTKKTFSPFKNFSDLLDSLTKTSVPVRMIPILVSNEEAEYIRSVINRNEEKYKDAIVQVEDQLVTLGLWIIYTLHDNE